MPLGSTRGHAQTSHPSGAFCGSAGTRLLQGNAVDKPVMVRRKKACLMETQAEGPPGDAPSGPAIMRKRRSVDRLADIDPTVRRVPPAAVVGEAVAPVAVPAMGEVAIAMEVLAAAI